MEFELQMAQMIRCIKYIHRSFAQLVEVKIMLVLRVVCGSDYKTPGAGSAPTT